VLGALNLALAGLLAWLWLTPGGELRHVRWEPPAPLPPALADAKALPEFDVDLVRYVATLERPLFVPTRRPPPKPEEVAAAPPPPDPLPDIRLLGLYGNQDVGGMIARIDGQVRRLRVGESIGTWSVKEVRRNEVVIVRADDVRTIELKRAGADTAVADADGGGRPTASASASASASPTAASSAEAQRQREIERARNQVRRMNALRARSGLPPLPEP
jgi:hypothetical protein